MVTPLVTETSYADLDELIKSQRAAVMPVPVAVIAAAVLADAWYWKACFAAILTTTYVLRRVLALP